jgi:RecG-like helicase
MNLKLKHYALLLAITGIAVLYFISLLSQPVLIDLSELPDYEDKQVIVEGTVTEYHVTTYGSQLITIKDKNNSATIFIEAEMDVEYGDRIRATGKVQKYNDGWEIIVSNKKFIETIQKWQNISIPLWQLAQKPSNYQGLNVNVTGVVDSLYDNYLYLTDLDGAYSLIVFYNPYMYSSLYPGQTVIVEGKFDFDQETFRYALTLSEQNHKISQVSGG